MDAAQAHFAADLAIGPPIGIVYMHFCTIRQDDGVIISFCSDLFFLLDRGYSAAFVAQIFLVPADISNL